MCLLKLGSAMPVLVDLSRDFTESLWRDVDLLPRAIWLAVNVGGTYIARQNPQLVVARQPRDSEPVTGAVCIVVTKDFRTGSIIDDRDPGFDAVFLWPELYRSSV